MDPRILLQIKSVCGVLGRDSMLVFDEGCIMSDLRMKGYEKGGENTHFGHFRVNVPVHFELVPVQFRFWSFLANMYRYMLDIYRYTLFWFSCSYQFLYFGHNLLISYPI